MEEIYYLFLDTCENTKTKEETLTFGELFQLYKNKTGKKGVSTFYGFIREQKTLGRIEERIKNQYTVLLEKVRETNENR